MTRAACLVLALLATAACSDEAGAPAKQGGAAAGEVQGGAISDAMIPLEQLESQAPLAPRQGPSAEDLDAEQPEVTPIDGTEGAAPGEGAEAGAPARPSSVAPDRAREGNAAEISPGWRSQTVSWQVSGARRLGRNDRDWVGIGQP